MFNPRQSSSPIFLVKIFIAWCLSLTEEMVPCTIAFHLKRFAHLCWRGLPHVAKTSLLWMTEAKMEPRTARSKPRHTTVCDASKRPRHSLYSVRGMMLQRLAVHSFPRNTTFEAFTSPCSCHATFGNGDGSLQICPPSTSSHLLRAFPSLAPMDRDPSHRCASLLRKCFLSQYTYILRPKRALSKPTARAHNTRHCQNLTRNTWRAKSKGGRQGTGRRITVHCSSKMRRTKEANKKKAVLCAGFALARNTASVYSKKPLAPMTITCNRFSKSWVCPGN